MDPLALFPRAKVAEEKHIPGRPAIKNRQSTDAGERAIAGLAVMSSLAAKAVPRVADEALQYLGGLDDVPWPGAPVGDIKRLSDLAKPTGGVKAKLLGLFPVSARPNRMIPDAQTIDAAINTINDAIPTVDSFIDKHKLPQKGVRLSLYKGPLSAIPGYHHLEKRVHLPFLSKPTIMHELGHVVDSSTPIGKVRYHAGPVLQSAVLSALPLAFIAGDEIKKMIPGTVDDKTINFMQNHAPAIAGATLAATELYPEFKASKIALQHIAKVEGLGAAKQAAKRLVPFFLSGLTSVIPAMVGMSLARKYMRQEGAAEKGITQKKKKILEELEKSGMLEPFMDMGRSWYDDIAHVGNEVASGAAKLINEPGRVRRVLNAAKNVGTSPQFISGALHAAVPATLGALYLYSTRSGKTLRARTPPEKRELYMSKLHPERMVANKVQESWRERNPLKFAGIVGLGAAVSSGVIARFLADIHKVL